jgi:hypothetical protein
MSLWTRASRVSVAPHVWSVVGLSQYSWRCETLQGLNSLRTGSVHLVTNEAADVQSESQHVHVVTTALFWRVYLVFTRPCTSVVVITKQTYHHAGMGVLVNSG